MRQSTLCTMLALAAAIPALSARAQSGNVFTPGYGGGGVSVMASNYGGAGESYGAADAYAEGYASGGPDIEAADYLADNCGYFFQYDYLLWSMNAPSITTIGDASAERFVTVNGVTYYFSNSLDTSWIDEPFTSAHRWEFGNQGLVDGWVGNVVYGTNEQSITTSGVNFMPNDPYQLLAGYQDGDGDGIDDDLDLDRVYGRFGVDLGTPDTTSASGYVLPFDGTPDVGAPIDTGDQVLYLPTFSTFTARNSTTLTGFEFMYSHRVSSGGPQGWMWFGGVRYLGLEDSFGFTGSGGVLDASSVDVTAYNNVIGPQIGARWIYRNGWFSLTTEGRFLAGYNVQRTSMIGQMATNSQATGTNEPAALIATGFNDAVNDDAFAPLGEVRIDGRFFINRYAAFRVGYTGFYAGGISRAAPKLVYELPEFQLTGAASREGLFVHAITLGIEINR